MASTAVPQALTDPEHFLPKMGHIYTIQDVRYFLRRRLGRTVPGTTLKRWKRILEVEPVYDGGEYLYSQSDIDALTTLGKWLRTPGSTVDGFRRKYNIHPTR